MREIFQLTNKNIGLATPLILYSIITSIYIAFMSQGTVLGALVGVLLFGLMFTAFIAGWFNMAKFAILNPDRDETTTWLIKEFAPGVGNYFLPSLGASIIMLILSLVFVIVTAFVGMKLIGNPGITSDALTKAMENTQALKDFLISLSPEQLVVINKWNFLMLGSMTVFYFLIFLYIPALFFSSKNPLKAYWISLKNTFSKKFFNTLGIFVTMFIINFILTILSALFAGGTIPHFIITLANFYFLTLAAIWLFQYYHKSFIEEQLGKNFDETI